MSYEKIDKWQIVLRFQPCMEYMKKSGMYRLHFGVFKLKRMPIEGTYPRPRDYQGFYLVYRIRMFRMWKEN